MEHEQGDVFGKNMAGKFLCPIEKDNVIEDFHETDSGQVSLRKKAKPNPPSDGQDASITSINGM